jgi:hypothetical protein
VRKSSFLIGLLLLCNTTGKTQSVNGLAFTPKSDTIRMLISGHWYGDAPNNSGLPTATVWAAIPKINQYDAVIHLGDLYRDVSFDHPKYRTEFYPELTVPLYNAVGNHDLTGNFYEQEIAPTDFVLKLQGGVFIILNTERNDGDLDDNQINLFRDSASVWKSQGIKYLFVCTHRPIWLESEADFKGLFPYRTKSVLGNNYNKKVLPVLRDLNKYFQIILLAGSKGDARASVFYEEGNEFPFTYVISAIRGFSDDSWIELVMTPDTLIWKHVACVGDKELPPLKNYNVDYWKSPDDSPAFNWRLFPLHIKNIFFSIEFWWGILLAIIIGMVTWILIRRVGR